MLNTPAGILKRYRETKDSTEATILAGQILELIAKLEANQKPDEPWFPETTTRGLDWLETPTDYTPSSQVLPCTVETEDNWEDYIRLYG